LIGSGGQFGCSSSINIACLPDNLVACAVSRTSEEGSEHLGYVHKCKHFTTCSPAPVGGPVGAACCTGATPAPKQRVLNRAQGAGANRSCVQGTRRRKLMACGAGNGDVVNVNVILHAHFELWCDMTTVDMTNWTLSPRHSPPQLFTSAVDVLRYLASNGAERPTFHNQIRSILNQDAVAKSWHRQRTFLYQMKYFRSYRRTRECKKFLLAARNLAAGTASLKQQQQVNGLNAEISGSNVVVPGGQLLFHGRGDCDLSHIRPFPSFLSTTLDPTVGIWHAIKGPLYPNRRPTVYALTLSRLICAIWGNGGAIKEWELLFGTSLSCTVNMIHNQAQFDVIEATLS
jgi:hypothetical protein